MDLSHLRLELGSCDNEVAALQSDRYTEVPLYYHNDNTHTHVAIVTVHYRIAIITV